MSHRCSARLLFVTIACLAAATSLHAADAEKAKKKLAKMDYEATEKGLCKAADDNDKKAVELFVEAGINLNGRCNWESTPLILAAEDGSVDVVAILLKAGADPNLRNKDERSALYYAAEGDSQDPTGKTLDALLAVPGIDTKTPYKHGATLVHLAVESDNDVGLKKLLAKGFDVNAADANGQTALGYAASFGRKKVLPILVKAPGVNLNAKTKDGDTPLMSCAATGEVESGIALLAAGADAKATAPDGSTALHRAVSVTKHNRKTFNVPDDRYLAFLDALLAAGVPVDAKKKYDGATALLVAVPEGHVPTVTALVAKGANPNVKNATGETPLLIASRDGDAAMVKALLDGKADPNAKDRVGRSALSLGQDYPEVVALLKGAGAKETTKKK